MYDNFFSISVIPIDAIRLPTSLIVNTVSGITICTTGTETSLVLIVISTPAGSIDNSIRLI